MFLNIKHVYVLPYKCRSQRLSLKYKEKLCELTQGKYFFEHELKYLGIYFINSYNSQKVKIPMARLSNIINL